MGDCFLCYLIGAKRWVGALRATSERYLDEEGRIFRDDVYPVRFRVEPVAQLDPEAGLPMEHFRGMLSFFPSEGGHQDWSGHVRSSPTRFREQDGRNVFDAIMAQAANPVRLPLEEKTVTMARRKQGKKQLASPTGPTGHEAVISEESNELPHLLSNETMGTTQSEGGSIASDVLNGDPVRGQDEGPEGLEEGDAEIHSREGVSIEKADRSLSELHRWYRSGRLIIDPEWQRSYVWDNRRASKLIESFLMDIPIPVVYLAKSEDGKYEVIDGVQRLSSVFEFFEGRLTLNGLEFMDHINKKKFKEIQASYQNKLEDATIRTFELSPKTSKNLLFIIFERLNTGGIALNEMEIRNCIFRGPLNDLIKELARTPAFVECVDQSNLSKRMYDRTLVLRFLVFYEKTYHKAQSGLKSFLNGFLQDFHKEPTAKKLQEWRSKFEGAMKASRTVFGQNGFRLWLTDRKGNGQWARNINASIFQCVSVSFSNHETSLLTRCSDAILEEYLV